MGTSKADRDASALFKFTLTGFDVVDGDLDGLADELLPQELLGLIGPVSLLGVARPGERWSHASDQTMQLRNHTDVPWSANRGELYPTLGLRSLLDNAKLVRAPNADDGALKIADDLLGRSGSSGLAVCGGDADRGRGSVVGPDTNTAVLSALFS